MELARSFGVLHVPDRSNQATPRLDGVMYISNLKTEGGERLGGLGSAELDWHTDQSYRERPATGSIFYAVEMPSGVGRIQWCNTQLAYDALPAPLQEQIAKSKRGRTYFSSKRGRTYFSSSGKISASTFLFPLTHDLQSFCGSPLHRRRRGCRVFADLQTTGREPTQPSSVITVATRVVS